MPFENLKVNTSSLSKCSIESIEEIMENVVKECRKEGGEIRIINSLKHDPPKRKLNSNDFLVYLGLKKGLNLREIEWWLDNPAQDKFYFSVESLGIIDGRKPYYKIPQISGRLYLPHISYFIRKIK